MKLLGLHDQLVLGNFCQIHALNEHNGDHRAVFWFLRHLDAPLRLFVNHVSPPLSIRPESASRTEGDNEHRQHSKGAFFKYKL
jgi:hypothetical protein